MAYLLTLTLMAITAIGLVTLRGHVLRSSTPVEVFAPLNRLLDHLGEDAQGLARATDRPSL